MMADNKVGIHYRLQRGEGRAKGNPVVHRPMFLTWQFREANFETIQSCNQFSHALCQNDPRAHKMRDEWK